MDVKQDAKEMRAALKSKNIFAVQSFGQRHWVLCKMELHLRSHPSSNGWGYPDYNEYRICIAWVKTTVKAARKPGWGRGKRPYPTQTHQRTALFRSEREAYIKYLMMPENYTWR